MPVGSKLPSGSYTLESSVPEIAVELDDPDLMLGLRKGTPVLTIDDMRPGDVLHHLSSGLRQYVLSLSGELYADFNPKIDGERSFDGYCDGLVRIALCDPSSWEVCGHSGSGTYADALEWRKRFLSDREPTPEHVANPAWRRAYRFNG